MQKRKKGGSVTSDILLQEHVMSATLSTVSNSMVVLFIAALKTTFYAMKTTFMDYM